MKQEFYSIADLFAHLRSPASKVSEGFCAIGRVSSALAAQVFAAAGLVVDGFQLVVDRSGVRHTLRKHGLNNAAAELAQGQIPIEDADFKALADWLPVPQAIRAGQPRPGQKPMPCVEFQLSSPTGQVSAILEYRPGRRRLVLTTMYKKMPTT